MVDLIFTPSYGIDLYMYSWIEHFFYAPILPRATAVSVCKCASWASNTLEDLGYTYGYDSSNSISYNGLIPN